MTQKELLSFIRSVLERNSSEVHHNFRDEEIRVYLNLAKDELMADAGGIPGVASITTVAGTQRYVMPTKLIKFGRVEFNSKQINRVETNMIEEFATTATAGSWTINFDTGY